MNQQNSDTPLSAATHSALTNNLSNALPPVPDGDSAAPAQSESLKAISEGARSDTFVLVVDDNVMNRNLLEAQLAQMGFQHIELQAEGKRPVEQGQGDHRLDQLIFMDCDMPLVNGYEAKLQIREFEASRDTHVLIIALTARGLGHERERC